VAAAEEEPGSMLQDVLSPDDHEPKGGEDIVVEEGRP